MLNASHRSISFPTIDNPGFFSWKSTRLTQGRGGHDVAEVSGTICRDVSLESGTPVVFNFGATAGRWWYGYVHTRHGITQQSSPEVTFTCIGPSYSLSGGGQFTWVNTTATSVVQELTRARGLALDITPMTRVYEHLSQAGRTDWQLLEHVARENARFLYVSGATVRFLSREAILSGFDPASPPTFGRSRTLYWEALQSEDPGSTRERTAIKSFSGVDPRLGTVLRVSGLPKVAPHGGKSGVPMFTDMATDTPVGSLAEATALSEAAVEESSWKYHLKADVQGDESLEPGSVIVLQDVGRFSGSWVVKAVSHVISDEEGYHCELDLMTDALGELPRVYLNPGQTPAPRPAATPVLRAAGRNRHPSDAFATGALRWQARNANTIITRPRPVAVGRPRVR